MPSAHRGRNSQSRPALKRSECTGSSSGRIARSLAPPLSRSIHLFRAPSMSTSPSSHPPPPSASPSLPYRRKEPKGALRIELREKPTRVTQPLPKCLGSLHARLPSLPSFLLSISSRSGDCGGRQRRWPRLAFPLSPVVVSASAHSHTQAAEASDIAPGAEKGIFSSVVNVIYFGMFKCNKGKGGFALPACM